MTRLSRVVAIAGATGLLTTTLAACGGGSESEKAKGTSEGFSAAADVTTCKADAKTADRPYGKTFPADWPFPPQSVVFNSEDRGGTGTIVTAVSSSRFKTILDFMNKDVVDAGFTIEKGETEEHDAEAEWKGSSFRGRWAIRESAGCPGETVIQVLSAAG